MKLVIQGSDKKIKQLARELKVRADRNNLKISLTEDKQEASKPPVKKAPVKKQENKESKAPKKNGGAVGSKKAK